MPIFNDLHGPTINGNIQPIKDMILPSFFQSEYWFNGNSEHGQHWFNRNSEYRQRRNDRNNGCDWHYWHQRNDNYFPANNTFFDLSNKRFKLSGANYASN